MIKKSNIIVLFFVLVSFVIQAQPRIIKADLPVDSIMKDVPATSLSTKNDTILPKIIKPDPMKVVWMGAIIPGYGQIINKKYWKLPIVYGGFLGFAYGISWSSSHYQSYRTAYYDILQYAENAEFKAKIDKDPSSSSFSKILPEGYTIDDFGGVSGYTSILKTKQATFRRYRDLNIFLSVGYYALTLVDAYVDAQLLDFDISPDLSMRFQPTLMHTNGGVASTVGVQCSFSLK